MRSFILAAVCLVSLSNTAGATIQIFDTIVYGEKEYPLFESPMKGYWHYRSWKPRHRAPGSVEIPDFKETSTSNHKGYVAQFEIRDSKLYLRNLSGRVQGKLRRNEELIPGKSFPLQATWYSGPAHIPLGDFNFATWRWPTALVFQIDKGVTTRVELKENVTNWFSTVRHGWRGVPYKLDDPDEMYREASGTKPNRSATTSVEWLNFKSPQAKKIEDALGAN